MSLNIMRTEQELVTNYWMCSLCACVLVIHLAISEAISVPWLFVHKLFHVSVNVVAVISRMGCVSAGAHVSISEARHPAN